jgi:hypothetical protein
MLLPCDLRTRIYRQKAEAPNSFKGRRLNVQVQEDKKGIMEVGFFYQVKKRAHYPTFHCGLQAAGLVPWHISPHKTNRMREAEDSKIQGWGMLGSPETTQS